MFRASDMMLIAVMVSAAAFTYKTKQEAETLASSVRKLEASIHFETDSIDLLKADWSLLTQPGRVQKLVEAYHADLPLQPIEPHQYARIEELPMRPLGIQDIINDSIDLLAQDDADLDGTMTGSVPE
jgi:hypothetical protein